MKKIKTVYLLYFIFFIGIIMFLLYIYLGFKYGAGVSKMGKELYEVKKEWKKNKEKSLDSIENGVVKKMDSIGKKADDTDIQ